MDRPHPVYDAKETATTSQVPEGKHQIKEQSLARTPQSGAEGAEASGDFWTHRKVSTAVSSWSSITPADQGPSSSEVESPKEVAAQQVFVPRKELWSNNHAPSLAHSEDPHDSFLHEQLRGNSTHTFLLSNTTESHLPVRPFENNTLTDWSTHDHRDSSEALAGDQLPAVFTSSTTSSAASESLSPLEQEKNQLLQSSFITGAENTHTKAVSSILHAPNLEEADYTQTATVDYSRDLVTNYSMGNKHPFLQLINSSESPQHSSSTSSGYIFYKVADDSFLEKPYYDPNAIEHLCNGTSTSGATGAFLSVVTLDHSSSGYLYNITDHVINCTNYSRDVSVARELELKNPLLGLLLSVFAMITICGNILVMIAVARERYLRTVTNYFIVSLAIADLIIGKFKIDLSRKKFLFLFFYSRREIFLKLKKERRR